MLIKNKTNMASNLDSKAFNQLIQDKIAKEENYIHWHNKVKELLKPLEGKQFNFRTFNKKRLGENFRFLSEYGGFYIQSPVGKHQIGSSYRGGTINVASFEEQDACHGRAAQERINKLKNTDVAKAYDLFRAIDEKFHALLDLLAEVDNQKLTSYHFPVYYDVLRLIHSNDKNGVSNLGQLLRINK